MSLIKSLLKPCYLYRPRVLMHRIWVEIIPPKGESALVPLPWGSLIDVSLQEAVGREIHKQRLFDIAVTETLWRLASKGDRVIDAGANIGYMTSLLAARVGSSGEVHSFEPHPEILPRLRCNIMRWQSEPDRATIVLHESALGDQCGEAELAETAYFGFNQGTASLAKRQQVADASEITRSHAVACTTLDHSFPEGRVALLKMDVEGYEINALKGARSLLEGRRIDNIVYEAHDDDGTRVHDFLVSFGFEILCLGYGQRGVTVSRLGSPRNLDLSWESPSYLATLVPDRVTKQLAARSWSVFH
jgi:FkbM family methyltransferase